MTFYKLTRIAPKYEEHAHTHRHRHTQTHKHTHTHTHRRTVFWQGILALVELHLSTPALQAVSLGLQQLQKPASISLTH